MIGHVVDIRKWGADRRSVLYRLTNDQTEFAMIVGTDIGRDGRAELVVFGRARMMPWQTMAGYGEGVGEFQFVQPQPETQDMLDILTGNKKPGAPLPDKEKEDGGSSSELIDPLDDKPARHTRSSAVRNTRI